jgi:hypothetical protein
MPVPGGTHTDVNVYDVNNYHDPTIFDNLRDTTSVRDANNVRDPSSNYTHEYAHVTVPNRDSNHTDQSTTTASSIIDTIDRVVNSNSSSRTTTPAVVSSRQNGSTERKRYRITHTNIIRRSFSDGNAFHGSEHQQTERRKRTQHPQRRLEYHAPAEPAAQKMRVQYARQYLRQHSADTLSIIILASILHRVTTTTTIPWLHIAVLPALTRSSASTWCQWCTRVLWWVFRHRTNAYMWISLGVVCIVYYLDQLLHTTITTAVLDGLSHTAINTVLNVVIASPSLRRAPAYVAHQLYDVLGIRGTIQIYITACLIPPIASVVHPIFPLIRYTGTAATNLIIRLRPRVGQSVTAIMSLLSLLLTVWRLGYLRQ